MVDKDSSSTQPALGEPISQHQRRMLHERLHWALIIISLAAAILCASMAIIRGYDAHQHFGPAQVGRWMGSWLVGFLVAGTIGYISFRMMQQWRDFSLQTYKLGLRFQTFESSTTVQWEEITAVYASAVRYGLPGLIWGKHTFLALETTQDVHLEIAPSLTGIEKLAEIIKQHVYPSLSERYKEQLDAGHSLQFGGILLTPSGITTPTRSVKWRDVAGVSLHNGLITLESNPAGAGSRLRLSTRNVPNVELLMQFIRRMGKLA
jgi:hypothetical protein